MSEREQFEAHAKRRGLSLAYGDVGYAYKETNEAWRAWQASREALKAEQGQTVQPIAWLNDAYLARGVVDGEAGDEDAGPGYIPVYREPFHSEGDGWIACADRIPDEREAVTVCDHGVDVYPAVFIGGEFYEYGDGLIEDALRMSNPTHWMPLPSPPATNHPIDTTPNQYEALGKGGEQ